MRLLILAIIVATCAVVHGNWHRSWHNSNPRQFDVDPIFSRQVQHGRGRMRNVDRKFQSRPLFRNRDAYNGMSHDRHEPIPELFMRNKVMHDKQAPIPQLYKGNKGVSNGLMHDKQAPIPQLYKGNKGVSNGLMHDKHAPIPQLYKGLDQQNSDHTHTSPCARPCPMIYMPVCGNNGRTYSNECEMEEDACRRRTRLFVTRQGKC